MTTRKSKHQFPDEYLRMPEPVATGFHETRVAAPLPGTPMVSIDPDALTQADWETIKRMALQRFVATTLDSPEGHLAYIRSRTASLALGHV